VWGYYRLYWWYNCRRWYTWCWGSGHSSVRKSNRCRRKTSVKGITFDCRALTCVSQNWSYGRDGVRGRVCNKANGFQEIVRVVYLGFVLLNTFPLLCSGLHYAFPLRPQKGRTQSFFSPASLGALQNKITNYNVIEFGTKITDGFHTLRFSVLGHTNKGLCNRECESEIRKRVVIVKQSKGIRGPLTHSATVKKTTRPLGRERVAKVPVPVNQIQHTRPVPLLT
jgi:hypothetical protein